MRDVEATIGCTYDWDHILHCTSIGLFQTYEYASGALN
jgi:hypothetical protein